MKKSIFFLVGFLLTYLAALGSVDRSFDFDKEFKTTNDIYFEKSKEEAKGSLVRFIQLSEANEEKVKKTSSLEYNWVLAMSWLHLWDVYQADKNTGKADEAMERSISYFDLIPRIASDTHYKENKRQCLMELLSQLQTHIVPKWKKSLDLGTGQKN